MVVKTYLSNRKYLAVVAVSTLFVCNRFYDYPLDELLTAPEQIEINGREFVLETALWRDFMPGPQAPPDGSPLNVIAYVVAIDSLSFPTSLDADLLWVIKDDADMWVTALESEMPTHNYELKKSAQDGPKWGPDIYVDVAIRVVDQDGRTYLLRAADQLIGATY